MMLHRLLQKNSIPPAKLAEVIQDVAAVASVPAMLLYPILLDEKKEERAQGIST